jgi:hypothetical protein
VTVSPDWVTMMFCQTPTVSAALLSTICSGSPFFSENRGRPVVSAVVVTMTYWLVPVPKSKTRIQFAKRAGLTQIDKLKSPSPSVTPVVGKLT